MRFLSIICCIYIGKRIKTINDNEREYIVSILKAYWTDFWSRRCGRIAGCALHNAEFKNETIRYEFQYFSTIAFRSMFRLTRSFRNSRIVKDLNCSNWAERFPVLHNPHNLLIHGHLNHLRPLAIIVASRCKNGIAIG